MNLIEIIEKRIFFSTSKLPDVIKTICVECINENGVIKYYIKITYHFHGKQLQDHVLVTSINPVIAYKGGWMFDRVQKFSEIPCDFEGHDATNENQIINWVGNLTFDDLIKIFDEALI